MSTRRKILEEAFNKAMFSPNLSIIGLAKAIHRDVASIKNVAVVTNHDKSLVVFNFVYYDREQIAVECAGPTKLNA